MPSTGTPRSKSPGSTCGASSAYTEAGPPERISASGLRARASAGEMRWPTSSEYTRHSRTRRAISCEYWPPRSTTRTGRSSGLGSVAGRGTTSPKLLCHSYSLGLLERAAWERGMEGGHAPVVTAARRLVRAGKRRANHDGVGAAGDRLGDVAAGSHPAVGDDVHVAPRVEEMLRACRGRVGDCRRLRNAYAEHASGRARGPGADADEHSCGAGAHEVQRGVLRRAAADDDGNWQLRDELLQIEHGAVRRHVLGRDHRALNDEHVEARAERDLVVVAHALRREGAGCEDAGRLDLLDALAHEVGVDRFAVDLLKAARRLRRRQGGDALELLVSFGIAGEDALEVDDPEPAELADQPRDLRRHDAVHCGGEHGQLEQVLTELPADVDVVGIAGAPAGDDGDVVEAPGAPGLLPQADLDVHAYLAPLTTKPRLRTSAWAPERTLPPRTCMRADGNRRLGGPFFTGSDPAKKHTRNVTKHARRRPPESARTPLKPA